MPSGPSRGTPLSGRSRMLACGALGLAVGGLLLLTRDLPVARGLEHVFEDVRIRAYAGDRTPDPRIVICQVQEGDVRALRKVGYAWPWDLDVNAAVVDVFRDAGVRALLIDVYQFDRGSGPDDLPTWLADSAPAAQAAELDAQGAAALVEALTSLGRAALAFELSGDAEFEIPARVAAAQGRLGASGLVPPRTAYARAGANLPVRRVLEGATLLGFANVDPDSPDGGLRRALTVGRWGDRPVLSLALAGASLVTRKTPALEGSRLVLGDVSTDLDPDGSFLVDYRGGAPGIYARIAPSQVVAWAQQRKDGKLPQAAVDALSGKIVVWGVNIGGIEDVVSTPISGTLDGPEFQASALDNLLNGGGRVHATPGANAALLLGACALVGLAGGAFKRKVWTHVAGVLGLAAVLAIAWTAFGRGVSVDLFAPLLGVLLAWGGATGLRLLTEGRYNRWLEGAFSRYLAPTVIDALKNDPALLELGGRRRRITLLFSDVAGFTKLSEKLQPPQTVHLLNEYLTAHCDAVFEAGGVIDKFMGDGVMAFFGDPIEMPDHAVRACRAALAVQERLPALRPVWEGLGLSEFVVRVGLNSGEAVVGNMGSRHRFDYTCMGDAVNLASRLEGANKAFGTRILLGENSYEDAKDAIVARALCRVGVVGRAAPEPIHELLALAGNASPDLLAHLEAFRRAQEAASAGDLDAADRALDEAERLRPGDGPTAWFRGLVREMRAGKVATRWSGVYVLAGK